MNGSTHGPLRHIEQSPERVCIALPTRHDAEGHLFDIREALTEARGGSMPSSDLVVWPAGLDRSILPKLHLSVRTRNALHSSGRNEGDDPLTVQDVLRIRNFGRTSLRDLLYRLEEFLVRCMHDATDDFEQPSQQLAETSSQFTGEAPSRQDAERHLFDIREALIEARGGSMPNLDLVVWPAGLDRSILPQLPLSVRTRNALHFSGQDEGDDPLTVQDVLRIRNFGRTSLRDLLYRLEEFLVRCTRNAIAESHPPAQQRAGISLRTPSEAPTKVEQPLSSWERAGRLLAPVLAAAEELYGHHDLLSSLRPDLGRLASKLGLATDLETIRVQDLVNGVRGLATVASKRLASVLNDTSVAERAVVEHRLSGSPRSSLREVGLMVGVTRERIRQVQMRLEPRLRTAIGKELTILASLEKERFGSLAEENVLGNRLEQILPFEHQLGKKYFREALISEMGYTLEDGVFFDTNVSRLVDHIASVVRTRADDVGLVAEEQLIVAVPDGWRSYWPWLRRRCGLSDLFGSLGVRASSKAKAKAALISIGRPATRGEIGRICGLDEVQVGTTLSNIPSVVRATKDEWGLKEWVDDEYDGVVGEIIQRIEEDGGATTTARLLTELPAKFGVSPLSVRAHMQTPKFVIRGGSISLASYSSVQLRTLDDVIAGRDAAGNPFWTFIVENRILEGHSVTGVPPEFANALGCEADAAGRVRIDNLPECRELSIGWQLASTTGASLGYLSEPLRRLGIEPGRRARVIIKGFLLASLSADDSTAKQASQGEADAILERMMLRRKVL